MSSTMKFIRDLGKFQKRWLDAIRHLITARHNIKNIIVFD